MDWKMSLGLIITAITFVLGAWINRNGAESDDMRNWISKTEAIALDNAERVHANEGRLNLIEVEYETIKDRVGEVNDDGTHALRRHEREGHR